MSKTKQESKRDLWDAMTLPVGVSRSCGNCIYKLGNITDLPCGMCQEVNSLVHWIWNGEKE